MRGNFITTEYIFEKVQRMLPPTAKLYMSEVVEFIYDCIRIIGGRNSTINGILHADLESNTFKIPPYIENIIRVFYLEQSKSIPIELKRVDKVTNYTKMSYMIENGFLYSDIEKGLIDVYYTTFPIDEKGKPLIPDTVYYEKAVIAYITERTMYRLYLQDLVKESIYERAKQEWLYFSGAARTASLMPTEDEEYDLKATMLGMMPRNIHRKGYPVTFGGHNEIEKVNISDSQQFIPYYNDDVVGT